MGAETGVGEVERVRGRRGVVACEVAEGVAGPWEVQDVV